MCFCVQMWNPSCGVLRNCVSKRPVVAVGFAQVNDDVTGLARICIGQMFAEYAVLPQLSILLNRHPNLRIEVRVNDRILDLASEA